MGRTKILMPTLKFYCQMYFFLPFRLSIIYRTGISKINSWTGYYYLIEKNPKIQKYIDKNIEGITLKYKQYTQINSQNRIKCLFMISSAWGYNAASTPRLAFPGIIINMCSLPPKHCCLSSTMRSLRLPAIGFQNTYNVNAPCAPAQSLIKRD